MVFKIADVGWVGVDLFFVLSGFLITRFLLEVKEGRYELRAFYLRRLARIVPAYFFCLAAVMIVIPLASDAYSVPTCVSQLPYWLYLSNFMAIAPNLGGLFSVGHFWSLAVEMHFYLLWPMVVLVLPRSWIVGVTIAGLVIAAGLRWWFVTAGADWEMTYAWTPMRMDPLLAGSLVAMITSMQISPDRVSRVAVPLLAGMVLAVVVVGWTHHGHDIFKLPGSPAIVLIRVAGFSVLALGFGAALALALHDNCLARFLSSPRLRLIATWSYGAYLVHFLFHPLFERTFGPPVLSRYLQDQNLAILGYFLIATLISFQLAALSYRFIEAPVIRLAHGAGRRVRRSPTG